MSKWYIIEGNIGSGKTTLLDKLAENNNYEVIREPVDVWQNIKNDKNENILQQFYKDPNRYAYLFQTIVFKTRLQSLDKIQEKEIRFSERSIWTDKYIFGKSCINSGIMNEIEKQAYLTWFDWLEQKFFKIPDGIIYLKSSPTKCFERMNKRGRSEESTVPLEYLQNLHDNHEEWMNKWDKTKLLVIDNDKDDNWDDIIQEIKNFI